MPIASEQSCAYDSVRFVVIIVRADQKINNYETLLQSSLALQEFCILMVNRIEIRDIAGFSEGI